jgi:hypothetical protein
VKSIFFCRGLKKCSTNLPAWNASEESPKIAARTVIHSIVCRACPDKASAPCDDGWLNFETPQLAIGHPMQKVRLPLNIFCIVKIGAQLMVARYHVLFRKATKLLVF